METFFADINWVGVLIGWFLAFMLGSIWYSPMMFLKKWKEGLGQQAVPGRPLGMLLVIQGLNTLVYAVVLALALQHSLFLAICVALLASSITKANGFYSGKTVYTITTESGYVIAQAAIIISVLILL